LTIPLPNHDGIVDDDDKGNMTDCDGLLAYMAGRSSSVGDIRKVMATKTKIPNTVRLLTSSTIQVDNNTYYLYKGESVEIDGYQYFAHSTYINYWICQHDDAYMEYALVDCSTKGGPVKMTCW
jgi:hypothetical protein